jgi:hypothetical protein
MLQKCLMYLKLIKKNGTEMLFMRNILYTKVRKRKSIMKLLRHVLSILYYKVPIYRYLTMKHC